MLIIFAALLLIGSVQAFAPMTAGRMVAKSSSVVMGSLVEVMKFKKQMNRFTFKTMAECIDAAGLTDMLSGGDYTVFACHDAGFEEYFGNTDKAALLADKEKLANIIKYHVVEGKVDGEALKTVGTLKTAQGSNLAAVMDGDRAFMNDESKVETTDIEADNGIFHIIDYPVRPPAAK